MPRIRFTEPATTTVARSGKKIPARRSPPHAAPDPRPGRGPPLTAVGPGAQRAATEGVPSVAASASACARRAAPRPQASHSAATAATATLVP